MTRKKTRIFLFEEHPLMILGVGALITREEEFLLAGSSSNTASLPEEISSARPDALIMDIALYTEPSTDFIRGVRKAFPNLPIVVLSVHRERRYALKAFKAGADGYVLKTEDPARLLDAVRAAQAGERYISSALQSDGRTSTSDIHSPIDRLSRRELEILQLVGKGRTARQIADTLDLPPKRIEEQTRSVQEKLELNNETELLQFAIHWVHHEGGFDS